MPAKVAVVGAGCSGSVAAWRLALAGLAPVVLDRDQQPGASVACGGVMLHALGRWLELPASLIDGEVTRLWLVDRRRRKRLDCVRPLFVSLDRRRLDCFLAERAVACGSELRSGCRVVDWDPRTGGLTWERAGQRVTETFDTVVFADGQRSVARRAGLGVGQGTPVGSAFYRELASDDDRCDEIELHLVLPAGVPGYLWVFPKRGYVQVGVGRLQRPGDLPLRYVLDEFIRDDDRLRLYRPLRAGGGTVPLTLARRFACPGGLVIGDAAGLVNPVTGGGLLYATSSGELAARAVTEGFQKGLDRAWIARRYCGLMRRSVHLWWLRSLGVAFRLQTIGAEGAGSWLPNAVLRLYARLTPSLALAAAALARGKG